MGIANKAALYLFGFLLINLNANAYWKCDESSRLSNGFCTSDYWIPENTPIKLNDRWTIQNTYTYGSHLQVKQWRNEYDLSYRNWTRTARDQNGNYYEPTSKDSNPTPRNKIVFAVYIDGVDAKTYFDDLKSAEAYMGNPPKDIAPKSSPETAVQTRNSNSGAAI